MPQGPGPLASAACAASGQTCPARQFQQNLLDKEWGNAMTENNPLTRTALAMTEDQVDRLKSFGVGMINLEDETQGWVDGNPERRRHVNRDARDLYNNTERKMTPVFARTIPASQQNVSVGTGANVSKVGMLWLGGQNACNDVNFLKKNSITVRFCCKEGWDCHLNNHFLHEKFVVDRYFGNDYRNKPASNNIDELKNAVMQIDEFLARGHNVLVYCRQGARRAASVVMTFLMAKCWMSSVEITHYLIKLRGIVEYDIIKSGNRLEREGHIYEWFKGDTQLLPSALSMTDVRGIANGTKTLQMQTHKFIKNRGGTWIKQQSREVVRVNTAASGQSKPLAKQNPAWASIRIWSVLEDVPEDAASGQTTQPEKADHDLDESWPRPTAEGPQKVKLHQQPKAPPPVLKRPEIFSMGKRAVPLEPLQFKAAPAKKNGAAAAAAKTSAPPPKNGRAIESPGDRGSSWGEDVGGLLGSSGKKQTKAEVAASGQKQEIKEEQKDALAVGLSDSVDSAGSFCIVAAEDCSSEGLSDSVGSIGLIPFKMTAEELHSVKERTQEIRQKIDAGHDGVPKGSHHADDFLAKAAASRKAALLQIDSEKGGISAKSGIAKALASDMVKDAGVGSVLAEGSKTPTEVPSPESDAPDWEDNEVEEADAAEAADAAAEAELAPVKAVSDQKDVKAVSDQQGVKAVSEQKDVKAVSEQKDAKAVSDQQDVTVKAVSENTRRLRAAQSGSDQKDASPVADQSGQAASGQTSTGDRPLAKDQETDEVKALKASVLKLKDELKKLEVERVNLAQAPWRLDVAAGPDTANIGEEIFNLVTANAFNGAMRLMQPDDIDIQFREAGGLTALHRAARAGHRHVMRLILRRWPESANLPSYSSRSPGLWTALHCLADASRQNLCINHDVAGCAKLLVQEMNGEMIGLQNSTGNTVFHLAAARGECGVDFLEQILPMMHAKLAAEPMATKSLQDILMLPNNKGATCMDHAVYKKDVYDLFKKYGARCLLEKPADWYTRTRPTHDQLRENKRSRAHKDFEYARRVSARGSDDSWQRWPDDDRGWQCSSSSSSGNGWRRH